MSMEDACLTNYDEQQQRNLSPAQLNTLARLARALYLRSIGRTTIVNKQTEMRRRRLALHEADHKVRHAMGILEHEKPINRTLSEALADLRAIMELSGEDRWQVLADLIYLVFQQRI